MERKPFPVIDPVATGANIVRLRKARSLTVRDLQAYFGFEEPQAIYKWQHGKSLPTVDNLYALGALLEVPMDQILVPFRTAETTYYKEDAAGGTSSSCFYLLFQANFYFLDFSVRERVSSRCKTSRYFRSFVAC